MDGLSLVLVLLTTLLTLVSILASFGPIQTRVKEYMIAFLVLEVGMLGVFLALDLFLFYVFWEVVLVPMYLIIGIWGGANRIYATIKFVIYTLVGSLLMLVAILAVAWTYQEATGTWEGAFDYETLVRRGHRPDAPAVGLPGLLPGLRHQGAHVALPHLAARRPHRGAHGRLGHPRRRAAQAGRLRPHPLQPAALPGRHAGPGAWLVIALSVVGMLYGAIVAIRQPDLKRLIAYSSVSHMGFVTLGIFVFGEQGLQGAIFQMVAHGVITGALFLLVGVIYERTHDRTIAKMGGLGARLPVFATLLVFFSLASAGLPGLAGFVGEFLVLLGAVDYQAILGYVAAFTIIFAAVYLLFMVQNTIFGELSDFLQGPRQQAHRRGPRRGHDAGAAGRADGRSWASSRRSCSISSGARDRDPGRRRAGRRQPRCGATTGLLP